MVQKYKYCTPAAVKKLKVIHYGKDWNDFDINKIRNIKNEWFVKPNGGFWTSPVNSEWGWVHMSEEMQWDYSKSIHFKFIKGTKIIIIDTLDDLLALPFTDAPIDILKYPDFELIAKYADAIWLTEKGQRETRLSYPRNLYGWDVETVFIMNPHCLIKVKGS